MRGHIGGGVAHVETGYLDSRDDRDGSNALVRNSELRFLVGYERELAVDLTLGGQYYLEHVRGRSALVRTPRPAASRRTRTAMCSPVGSLG